jgi:cysteine-S-conjugate beta-lyase
MKRYHFDQVWERRGTDSLKWGKYGNEILPLWIAEMDFPPADEIRDSLHERLAHGIFGYANAQPELYELIQERLFRLYRWEVQKEEICFIPTLVAGLNYAFQTFAKTGEGVLVQTPVYHHFVKDPLVHGRRLDVSPLVRKGDTYEIDFEDLERQITDQTKIFLFCNPHNPVGRVFRIEEMRKIAEICLRRNLILCSDEIHAELVYPGYQHIPMATLDPEIAQRTITLMSPTKAFNFPGVHFGFAIIPNKTLRRAWRRFSHGLNEGVNILGQVAACAAYKYGQSWLDQVLLYLQENRDFLSRFVREKLPGIQMTKAEATYLGWLDCRQAGISGSPSDFFLNQAEVALFDGKEFGLGGEGFLRFNFACPRRILEMALHRMELSLNKNSFPPAVP